MNKLKTQPERSPEQKEQLPAFMVQQANFVCLAGFTQQRSILYLVAGRSLMRDNEAQVQEVRALTCYEYCFKNQITK
ncbi:hypothetical protein [Xenorhabdus miraniensis]|uniref:Uncharacterized protein n=1 Tax=Xenorhabdus miraniensis TaxID=351674 RepID=A0A2D0JQA7_9GAMM|nr:hypothetical protein [Xenorhabdus miraniensis]PHM48521.1 hypothetical protein Xmir_02324 [Xenorhabdus miraniensis]